MSKHERDEIRRTITRISEDDIKSFHLLTQISKVKSKVISSTINVSQKRRLSVNQNKLFFDFKIVLDSKHRKHISLSNVRKIDEISNSASNIVNADIECLIFHEESSITYESFLKFDQAEDVIIENVNTRDCTFVAIKTFKQSKKINFTTLMRCENDNIIRLLNVIHRKNHDVILIYEQMKISLRLINENFYVKWKTYEIAAICKKIILETYLIAVILFDESDAEWN